MPLDPALKVVLDQLSQGDAPKLHEVSPEQARQFFDAMQLPQAEIPVGSVEDSAFAGPGGDVPVRIYRPEGEARPPLLVYFHGGGWVIGSIETHDGTCRELSRRGRCAVVSVDYRLAPEHRYPAAADDCYAALEWAVGNAPALGVDAGRLAVGGDSAGGNLAAAVALMARDRGGPSLALQLLIYPVVDADFGRASYRENAEGYLLEADSMKWFWGHYVPDESQRREPYAAPLHASDLAGLPPAHVVTAEYDPLRDEGEAYAAALDRAGVPTTLARYDGMIHGFFAMGMLAESARSAVQRAGEALETALHG